MLRMLIYVTVLLPILVKQQHLSLQNKGRFFLLFLLWYFVTGSRSKPGSFF